MADQSAERAVRCLRQLCGKDRITRCILRIVGLSEDNKSGVESVGERCVKLFVSLHRKRDPSARSEENNAGFRSLVAD
jgi:hypothetical protein